MKIKLLCAIVLVALAGASALEPRRIEIVGGNVGKPEPYVPSIARAPVVFMTGTSSTSTNAGVVWTSAGSLTVQTIGQGGSGGAYGPTSVSLTTSTR